MKTLKTALTFLLSTTILLTACGQDPSLQILTISSVKDPLREIIRAYKRENPKTKFKMVFKSTGPIYNEIDGDQSNSNIVIMLNSEWLNNLMNSNKVSNVEKFGKNSLILVGSVYAKDSIAAPAEIVTLIGNTKFGIDDPASNVSGRLTVDLLKYYNIYDDIKDKLKFFPSTRSTLQAVEVSQVIYGIVFQTNALVSDDIKTIYTFPQESYTPIIYSIGAVSYNYNKACKKFIDFVKTEDAREILESYGFL